MKRPFSERYEIASCNVLVSLLEKSPFSFDGMQYEDWRGNYSSSDEAGGKRKTIHTLPGCKFRLETESTTYKVNSSYEKKEYTARDLAIDISGSISPGVDPYYPKREEKTLQERLQENLEERLGINLDMLVREKVSS